MGQLVELPLAAGGGGGRRAGPTIYERNVGGEDRSRREVPRLVATGLAITWRAAS